MHTLIWCVYKFLACVFVYVCCLKLFKQDGLLWLFVPFTMCHDFKELHGFDDLKFLLKHNYVDVKMQDGINVHQCMYVIY